MTARPPERTIDVSGIYDDETLHEYLSKTLGFPGYYGFNWHAFWDCICDEDQSCMPDILKVRGFDELRRLAPESAQKFEACLKDYVSEFKDRSVVFEPTA
jgi:RNAse (barnase) inhibitor barstar